MTMKRPPELQAIFDAIERVGPYTSIEEVNRLLQARMRDYNARAQPSLGGLSPNAMTQLLHGDWVSQGVLRLDEGLAYENLAGAAILADARTLLEYVRDEGPVKETAARYLPRAVVAALLPRLRMPGQPRIVFDVAAPPPLNEGDVLWLPALRHILMFGGLLARRKGLRITPRGRTLLSELRAGELYALLFRTLFRTLDLRSLGRTEGHEALQSTIAFSFHQLRSAAREWASAEALAQLAWLDGAKDPPTEWEVANVDFRYFTFQHRVLDPLVQFDLLESRFVPSDGHLREREYRCAPLFGRFLRFEFKSR